MPFDARVTALLRQIIDAGDKLTHLNSSKLGRHALAWRAGELPLTTV
jgi:hypothetical protein